jgi:ribosome-binding factor A
VICSGRFSPDRRENPFIATNGSYKRLQQIAGKSSRILSKDKKLRVFVPLWQRNFKKSYFCIMETNRQKKIGGVIQKDLVDILQGEIRKNGISNLVISVSKVLVTSDLSVATVHLSIFPQEKAAETLAAIKSNTPLIKHDLAQRVKLQLRKVPNLTFYIDDSLDYIEKIDNALSKKENPIENRDLLERRKKS